MGSGAARDGEREEGGVVNERIDRRMRRGGGLMEIGLMEGKAKGRKGRGSLSQLTKLVDSRETTEKESQREEEERVGEAVVHTAQTQTKEGFSCELERKGVWS